MSQISTLKHTNIFLVIHVRDTFLALKEATLAAKHNIDGLFFISHHGADNEVINIASTVKTKHPALKIGINLLSTGPIAAMEAAIQFNLDMAWGDNCGVNSDGCADLAYRLQALQKEDPMLVLYASVAFKYQPDDHNPAGAAMKAMEMGFLPTTSGSGTGSPPTVEKISDMSRATGGILGVASGMTPGNVHLYAPYLSDILVATGVARDEYRFDSQKLGAFVTAVRETDLLRP